jgi:hypothetical protein
MPIFEPADSDVVLNIRRVKEDSNPALNRIVIKAGAKDTGSIGVDDTVDPTSGTAVQFRINNKILGSSSTDVGYAFPPSTPNPVQGKPDIVNAICVVKSQDPNVTCKAGTFPDGSNGVAGWEAEWISGSTLLLKVPKLDSATYKYNLFFDRYDSNGGVAKVQIDPRIKNGGVAYSAKDLLPPSFYPAGFSGNMLLLLAILLLAAGTVFGWALAGGRKS